MKSLTSISSAVCLALLACGKASGPAPCDPLVCDGLFSRFDAGPMDGQPIDAGALDGGSDGGGLDGGLDAGLPCTQGLLQNGSFECGLSGWQILQGVARVADSGAIEGRYAVELTADSNGQARLNSASPIAIDDATTLCVSSKVQGTVTKARIEVLRSPDNWSVGFTSPVTSSWVSLPPSRLAVEVPRNSQVWVVVRAVDAAAGQQLWVDDLVMEEGANGHCP